MLKALLCFVLLRLLTSQTGAVETPNIVLIYADDLGWGDLGCYGAERVATPNIDRLAAEGVRFTDAHCTSATCTPSRYALLTGQYPWRKKGTGVLPGDAPLIIDPAQVTLPGILQKAGYVTGVVGKWHLGLGSGSLDWNGEIRPGPLDVGFNQAFIMAATGDRVPCVYVEDRTVFGLDKSDPITVRYGQPLPDLPTGRANPELLRIHPSHGHDMAIVNGVSRIGFMSGGKSALWNDETMADEFTNRGVAFIRKHKSSSFFLLFASHDIHVPRIPHPRFAGKSAMGPRGDAIAEFDWCVGEILKTLTETGLNERTIVLLTSDNGPVVDDGYKDEAVAKLGDHRPAGPWRGGKYSLFEGGTRVPTIIRWPGKVTPGVSRALVNQVDLARSFAAMTGQEIPAGGAPDSLDQLDAWLGQNPKGREWSIHHASGRALREGSWKFIPAGKGAKLYPATNTESGIDSADRLYDLSKDPGEQDDVAAENPERVAAMAAKLAELGTSRP